MLFLFIYLKIYYQAQKFRLCCQLSPAAHCTGCTHALDKAIDDNSCCVASAPPLAWLKHVAFSQHSHFHIFRKISSYFLEDFRKISSYCPEDFRKISYYIFPGRLPENKLLFPGSLPENNLIHVYIDS